MILLNVIDFIGRFHPVFVHLPIGILLLACLFQLMGSYPRYASLRPAVPAMTFWGSLAAILSCITGVILAGEGDYNESVTGRHQWFGIAVALVAVTMYVLQKTKARESVLKLFSIAVFVLITITGHLGGSITHGEEYLSFSSDDEVIEIKPVPDIQNAAAYENVIKPLLEARCYSCHSAKKQKGKLRLDDPEFIMKGGSEGEVIVKGQPGASELIERMTLPEDNEDRMPPKGKPQLTAEQIAAIHWWIASGADFSRKVKELPQDKNALAALTALESGVSAAGSDDRLVPSDPVEAADTAAIGKLQRKGVMIINVAQNSNYLYANFVAADSSDDNTVRQLLPLRKQLIWLKLDDSDISDEAMDAIAELKALTRLQLNNTNISDKGIAKLQTLESLQSVNLVGTQVSATGLASLKGLKNLKTIYVYQSAIAPAEWVNLKNIFPETRIDTGNYRLPMLATDTTRLTMPEN